MRHNKFIGWNSFFEALERVQKVSPWLSRQIARRASEWPFWYSGLRIGDWHDRQVRVCMPFSVRNSLDGEICQGHLLLGAELSLRLLLLRYRQEFPFRYRVRGVRVQALHVVDQAVDFKFEIPLEEWDQLRLRMAASNWTDAEFMVSSYLADGRAAVTFTFDLAFQLEKLLPS